MVYRPTAIGYMLQHGEWEAARREIRSAVEATGGNVLVAARVLCVSHRHLCRLLHRANLWAEVDALRRQAKILPDEIERARALLLGKDRRP